MPVVKGWLRISLRKINTSHHPFHQEILSHRDYFSSDVQPVNEGEKYEIDVQVWRTSVVLEFSETGA